MTIDDRMKLSYYRELSPLNEEHEVFVVQHTETNALFLKKTLENYQLDIFMRLKAHPVPNMPHIIEAVEDNGRLIVIETYLTGETLQQKLDRNGPLPVSLVRSIGIQLCTILGNLHMMGIVHRDIKPDNIIFEEPGIIKLLDLDAAKVYKSGEYRDTQLIGTKEYAAPEQYGFGASSPVTDIYAVGILMNVLVTGQYPRMALTTDASLRAIIQRSIRMEPSERYKSVNDLKDALSESPTSSVYNETERYNPQVSSAAPIKQTIPSNPVQPTAYAYSTSSPVKVSIVDTVMNAGSGWRRFLPPGFRSGTVWHMLIAVFWYYFAISTGVKKILEPEVSLTAAENGLNAYMFIVLTITIPFVLCNYCGVLDKARITRIKSRAIRVIIACLFMMLVSGILFEIGKLVIRLTGN